MILTPNGDGTATVSDFDCPSGCGVTFSDLSGAVEFNKESEAEDGTISYKTNITFDERTRRVLALHAELMHDHV